MEPGVIEGRSGVEVVGCGFSLCLSKLSERKSVVSVVREEERRVGLGVVRSNQGFLMFNLIRIMCG